MPTLGTINEKNSRRFRQRMASEREARILGKSKAITSDLMAEMAQVFGENFDSGEAKNISEVLASEHQCFENAMTPQELEQFSHQTVVGIGQYYRKNKSEGYILVLNSKKTLADGVPGLGFPGGRVRLGESPDVRLWKEYKEETNLGCEVINPDFPPVAEHKIGEEEHKFTAYEVKITGGKPQARPTKDEPITDVIPLNEEILKEACQNDSRIRVKTNGKNIVVGILRNHRRAFLEFLRKRDAVQTTVSQEALNV